MMKQFSFLFTWLFVLGMTSSASGQNIYPEKFDDCALSSFCLDCGDPRAAYPTDLTAYFQDKLPAAILKRYKGLALVQVLVDTAGQPCTKSQTTNLGAGALAQLNLRGLVNGMGRWTPAREKGKPINVSASLRFAFDGEGRVAVSYQRFDMSKATNLRSVGDVEILNKRYRYPAHPKGVKLETFTQANSSIPWDMMRVALPDQNNTVWVGTDNGLVKIEKGHMTLLNATNTGLLPSPSHKIDILYAAVDSRNNKWFSTGYDAYRYNGTTWTRFDSTTTPLHWLTSMHADAAGNVWFGSSKGLVKYDGQAWTLLSSQNSKVPAGMISGIYVDRQKRLWVSTYKGSIRLDGAQQAAAFSLRETPLATASFTSAAEDTDGSIWFGLYDGDKQKQLSGLAKYTPDGKWTSFTAANSGFPGNDVLDIVVDQQHVVWASVNRVGLCRFDGSAWTLFTPENSTVPSTIITDLALDADGALWCATHAGLLKVTPR